MSNSVKKQGISLDVIKFVKNHPYSFFLAFCIIISLFFGISFSPQATNLLMETNTIKLERDKLKAQLNSYENIPIIDKRLSNIMEEEPYGWNRDLPPKILNILNEKFGYSDKNNRSIHKRILQVVKEVEEGKIILELLIQIGNTSSYQDIEEYDFICRDNVQTSEQCDYWDLEEIEKEVVFTQLPNSHQKSIKDNCKLVYQIEKSIYGDKKYEHEVKCFDVKDGNWLVRGFRINKDGSIDDEEVDVDLYR